MSWKLAIWSLGLITTDKVATNLINFLWFMMYVLYSMVRCFRVSVVQGVSCFHCMVCGCQEEGKIAAIKTRYKGLRVVATAKVATKLDKSFLWFTMYVLRNMPTYFRDWTVFKIA